MKRLLLDSYSQLSRASGAGERRPVLVEQLADVGPGVLRHATEGLGTVWNAKVTQLVP